MYPLLFFLWILLNGRLTLEIGIFGIIIVSAVYWIMCRFLEYDPGNERIIFKNLWNIICYIAILIVEMFRSGLTVLRFVTSRSIQIEPQIVVFRVPLKNDFLKTILANSITLTPGTITLNVIDDRFYIHALDYTLAEGIENSIFQRILVKIEENMEVSAHD